METKLIVVLLSLLQYSLLKADTITDTINSAVVFNQMLEESVLFTSPWEDSTYANHQFGAVEVTPKCLIDLKLYITHLGQRKMWAIKMFDSTGKIPDGMLKGHLASLGNFDECLSVKSKEPNIKGKYCLLFDLSSGVSNNASFDVLGLFIRRGVCVPDSCSGQDVQSFLQHIASQFNITVYVPEEGCSTEGSVQLDAGDIVFITIICIIVAFILVMTVIPLLPGVTKQSEESYNYSRLRFANRETRLDKLCGFAKQFSFVENFKKLFQARNKGNISCLDGIRCFSMTWVLFGHSLYKGLPMEFANMYDIHEYFRSFWVQCLFNATVSVDTFFLISGMLWGFALLKQLSKIPGNESEHRMLRVPGLIGTLYLIRYIRLTPILMILVGLTATVLRKMGSGPIWDMGLRPEQQNCQQYWWTDMLYVQNYVNPGETCLNHSWYLACDMQFFLIAPFLMLLVLKNKIIGLTIIIVLIMASNVYVTVYTAINNGIPTAIMNWHFFDVSFADYWNYIYVPAYARFGPYGIGLLLGYLLHKYQNRIWSPNKVYVVIGWCVSVAAGIGVVYGLYQFNNDPHAIQPNSAAAFYAGFHRTIWALAVAWVIFACHLNYGGPVNTILSLRVFSPFSRLTYSMYLLSYLIQICIAMSVRMGFYFDGFVVPYYIFFGSVVFTFIAAIFSSLLLESPSVALIKLISRSLDGSRKKESSPAPVILNYADVVHEKVFDGVTAPVPPPRSRKY